jgi:hypothetical protein
MDCPDVYVFICENLGNDLNSPECREIREHLDGCRDCRVELDSLKKMVALYKETPAPGVSPSIRTRIMQLIDREWKSEPDAPR